MGQQIRSRPGAGEWLPCGAGQFFNQIGRRRRVAIHAGSESIGLGLQA